jgi:hypothetical protein
MKFEWTEEDRQANIAQRTEIYNDLQMVLAGHNALPALQAICDCLAVTVVMLTKSKRDDAHDLLDRLLPDLKRTADNNLDLVAEQMARSFPGGAA